MRHGSWALRMAALAGLATAVAALPVFAAEEEEEEEEEQEEEVSWYAENGLYLVGAAMYGFPTDEGQLEDRVEDAIEGPSSARDVRGSFGFDTRLGYRVDPRAAIEGQFVWIRSFDVRADTAGGTVEAEARFLATTANAKIFLLTDRVQPYVVAGIGWGWSHLQVPGTTDERDGNFVARAGAGVDLYGSRFVALNLEASYLLADTDIDPFDHVSIGAGLTLRFYAE
jgi:opacity protein-like surface antigen